MTFNITEGPKVKVGNIDITGNSAFSDRAVIRMMKNLHPYGIPHSIFLEGIFPKTFDQAKLEEDKERIRQAYQDKGYFTAKALDETLKISLKGGRGWRLPLIKTNSQGIAADLTIPVEEGRLYKLNKANFQGVKFFREPSVLLNLFGMHEGDVFSTDKLRKGIENLRKLYGQFGFFDFVPEPSFDIIPNTDKIDLTITADEGKQFFIRRIDFSGNTTTRDKVIRREILLDEGDLFNSQLWDYSILRLNQLGYFEMLKKEDAADIRRNPQTNTLDITLKVKERGKNSIGLNGGVSGIAGSFMGFNYSTNNFLGLGETLSVESQLGTRMRDVSFGFTEPYFLDRPLQLGFVVYLRAFNFDQGREASILAGQDLIPLYNQLGSQNLLNYTQNSHGFSVSGSYPLRRSFARLGLTYAFDISTTKTLTTAANDYFQYINFSGVAGPNSLTGVRTSHIVPSYTYNTVNHPISPTAGRSLFASFDFAGGILGGNVNTIRPTLDFKYFQAGALAQEPHPGAAPDGYHDYRLRRQVCSALLPYLYGRRAGHPRLRNLGHHADRLHPVLLAGEYPERRWLGAHAEDRQRRADRECAGHHDGADLSADHARRRYPAAGQLRIPHPDRRTGHSGAVLRCRRGQDSAQRTA